MVQPAKRTLTVAKAAVDEIIDIDQRLTRLVFAFLGTATFWLVFGTMVGELAGIKFV